MRKGRGKTKIVTSHKGSKGKPGTGRRKAFSHMSKKVRRGHKGYPMKHIVKSSMTYKKKGRKR